MRRHIGLLQFQAIAVVFVLVWRPLRTLMMLVRLAMALTPINGITPQGCEALASASIGFDLHVNSENLILHMARVVHKMRGVFVLWL